MFGRVLNTLLIYYAESHLSENVAGDFTIGNSQRRSFQTYKLTTWIPRWNHVETAVSTSFQRGIHMVCL